MGEKRCKNCIWFDQCGIDVACEDYDPVSDEEREAEAVNKYEQDLRCRHELYSKQIKEQDS